MTQSARVPDELLSRFRVVAIERLARVDAAWTALVRGEGDSEMQKQLLREVHTLKGDAKVVGLAEASILCQRLEDLLTAASAKGFRVHDDVDIVVTMAIQFVAMLVRKRTLGSAIDLRGFLKQIEEVMGEWLRRSSEAPDKKLSVGPHLRVKDPPRVTVSTGLRLSSSCTAVFLEHLRAPEDQKVRLRELWRQLREGVEEAHSTPLEPIVAGHVATAATLAEGLGKDVSIEIEGEQTAVGPETGDVLGIVLLHGLRNAVDHGVEPPEERRRTNKTADGVIRVTVTRIGGDVELRIEDNGAGIDIERVRARAVERGFLSADIAPAATDEEILEYLFASGLSTRDATSEISGRGIGLDAVHAAVIEHGGTLRVETKRGASTTVVARVPDSRGRIDVLVFDAPFAGGVRFAVPSTVGLKRVDETPNLVLEDVLRLPRTPARSATPFEVVGAPTHVVVAAGSRPETRYALRRCVTPEKDLVEIVWVDELEVILVRPERIHAVRAS